MANSAGGGKGNLQGEFGMPNIVKKKKQDYQCQPFWGLCAESLEVGDKGFFKVGILDNVDSVDFITQCV